MTDEYDVGFYLKRARVLETSLVYEKSLRHIRWVLNVICGSLQQSATDSRKSGCGGWI